MFHHLNNPIYAVLIDSTINDYLINHCGYSVASSEQIGLVANTYCDYFGSVAYPGKLDVGLRVVRIGKSSVMYECGIFEEGKEHVKAVGGLVQIWVRNDTSKPAAEGIGKSIRAGLEKLANTTGAQQDKAKL